MDGDYTGATHTYIYETLENIKEPIITETFTLPDDIKNELMGAKTPFKSAYAEAVYYRTYSRKKDNGKKECWAETVIRVIEGTMGAYLTHYKKNGLTINESEMTEFAGNMAKSCFKRQWCPPGRGLHSMGTDHTRRNGNASLNNCYACETKNLVLAASWAMDQLMCGGGVGFDCSWDGIAFMPNKLDYMTYNIPDTRQGWISGLELLLRSYIPVDGKITNKFPKFNYELIRPYGVPIKGFGGTSSGPEPLQVLLASVEIFLDTYIKYQTNPDPDLFRQLLIRLNENYALIGNINNEMEELNKAIETGKKSYDKTRLVVDILNAIGGCVVAGNVRRSAEIAIGDAGDATFLDLKNLEVNPERKNIMWLSNNTVRFTKNEDFSEYIPKIAKKIQNNGEPGFFNLINAKKFGRYTDTTYGEDTGNLLNPCVTGETYVMTDQGMRQVLELVGTSFNAVVDGRCYSSSSVGFWKTGQKETYIITLENGMKVEATDNHKFLMKHQNEYVWTEVKNMRKNNVLALSNNTDYYWEGGNGSWDDGYFCGLLLQNGHANSLNTEISFNISKEEKITDHQQAKFIENLYRREKIVFPGWIIGGEKENYRTYTTEITNQFVEIAKKFGINLNDKKIPQTHLSYNFTSGFLLAFFASKSIIQHNINSKYIRQSQPNIEILENVQRLLASIGINSCIKTNRSLDNKIENYELSIVKNSTELFNSKINLGDTFESSNRWNSKIVDISRGGIKDVYDCTINVIHAFSANGIMSHNCGEIILKSFEPCTLSTICPSNCRNEIGEIDHDLVLKAAQFATFYATTVTCVKHHWGVSNAVIAHNRRIGVSLTGISNIYEEYGFTYLTKLCRDLYNEIRNYNQAYAARSGIPRAIRVTTVKPEGTLSIIMEVNAGVHFPTFRYARRRIAISKSDDILKCLIDAGYPTEQSIYNVNTMYVIFPLEFGKCRPSREVTIYEQFGIVSALQRSYADNSVSFTGNFSVEREGEDVERVIAMYAPQIKSCSMMPYRDKVEQQPYPHMPFEEINQTEYLTLLSQTKPVSWNFIDSTDIQAPAGCTNDVCTL